MTKRGKGQSDDGPQTTLNEKRGGGLTEVLNQKKISRKVREERFKINQARSCERKLHPRGGSYSSLETKEVYTAM